MNERSPADVQPPCQMADSRVSKPQTADQDGGCKLGNSILKVFNLVWVCFDKTLDFNR